MFSAVPGPFRQLSEIVRRCVIAACACASFAVCRVQADPLEPWTAGHGDIGVAYAGTGTAFDMEVHLHAGAIVNGSALGTDATYEPGAAAIVVPVAANLKAINSPTGQWAGDTNGYNFVTTGSTLGVAPGGNLWVLSFNASDASVYGTPFLGWAAEEGFGDGDGWSDVTLTPFSFNSPTGGNMGIFDQNDDLSALWILNHGDSVFSADSFAITAPDHVHRVLAFTQPGVYEVGIRAESTLAGTGLVVGQGVYTFQVVPEPSSMLLAGGGIVIAGLAAMRRRGIRRKAGCTPF